MIHYKTNMHVNSYIPKLINNNYLKKSDCYFYHINSFKSIYS